METNLVGYLLNSLDQTTHNQVEAHLRASPEARRQLELLRQALVPLSADAEHPVPPADLSVRSLAKVAEFRCRDLPRLPRPVSSSGGGVRPWLQRGDVLVAACLLLTVLGLATPALSRLRVQYAKGECQNNLRQFHAALASYYDIHGQLPNFYRQAPHKVTGLIAPLLHDAGVLPNATSIRCPSNNMAVPVAFSPVAFSMDLIQNFSAEQFAAEAPQLLPSYAYSLGYSDDAGYHVPDRPRDALASALPLMADCPPPIPGDGCHRVALPPGVAALIQPLPMCHIPVPNSFNHGGLGQNVLYHDGHVRFATIRTVGIEGDDIYLNRKMQLAPGIDPFDTVLAPGAVHP